MQFFKVWVVVSLKNIVTRPVCLCCSCFWCLQHSILLVKAFCYAIFVCLFVHTDVVTTIFHERLEKFFIKLTGNITSPCSPVVKAISTRAPYAVPRVSHAQEPGFKPQPRARLPTKELFLIIPTHMMNREVIPGRKKRVRRCPL